MKRLLLALLLLFPASVLGGESGSSVPETQAPMHSTAADGSSRAEDPEMTASTGLRQIEMFEVKIDEGFSSEGVAPDAATALIVNPFTVRKRGRYYGSVYWYHRNDNFDARNFFDPVGVSLPEFKRNQFGVSLGAFITDELKIFGSYEGLRIIKGSTRVSHVPTAAMKQGDFSNVPWLDEGFELYDPLTGEAFEDNRIPRSRIHPVALNLLNLFPDPNRIGTSSNYVNNEPVVERSNRFSTRVDFELSPKTKVFGTYNIDDGTTKQVADLPVFGTTANERSQDVSIDLVHSFSASKVLNLKLSYDREVSLRLSDQSFQEGLLESVGINGVSVLDPMDEGYPRMNIGSYAGIGASAGFAAFGFASEAPESFHENRYTIESSYNYVRGNHNFVFGGELNVIQLNNMRTWGTRRGSFGYSGFFTYDPRNLSNDPVERALANPNSGDAFADFLLGIPYTATRGVGSDRLDLRQRLWQLYIRDTWKLNRNFTLSMGLAYSYTPFFHSIHNNVSFFYPLVFNPPLDGEVVVTGSNRARELGLDLDPGHAAYNDRNRWQPNAGIAYSPLGNNRLIFRASYSIRHDDMNAFQALLYVGRNYPFFYNERVDSPNRPDLDIGNPFEAAAVPSLTFKAADPDLRNPFIQDFNVSVQFEFLSNWNVELTYSARRISNYQRVIPGNIPLPDPTPDLPIQVRRPNPNFGMFEILKSDATYSSNGMDARVTRRMNELFSVTADFRWDKAITDGWSWISANPNNPRDLDAERSVSGFLPEKRLAVNYILDLPLGKNRLLSTEWAGKFARLFEGWRISGTTSIMGGGRFSVMVFGDPNNDGVWGDRANRVGSGTLPSDERSIDKWFETSDFEIPGYYGADAELFGNAGRNTLTGPGSTQWDISFLKSTRVTESGHLLELRIQLFNAFNHVNFHQPGNYINLPTFGVISGADDAREIEIALKYSF